MNAELLYEALSDPNSLEQLNEHELKRLINAHPYFSVGQLLLAKKYRMEEDKDSYQRQREHLHAFYRNPWWLFYQLELSDQTNHHQYVYTQHYKPAAAFETIARPGVPKDIVPAPEVVVTAPEMAEVWPEAHSPEVQEEAPQAAWPEAHSPEVQEATEEPVAYVAEEPVAHVAEAPVAHVAEEPVAYVAEEPVALEPEPAEPEAAEPGPAEAEEAEHEVVVQEPEAPRRAFVPWPGMDEEIIDIPTLMGAPEASSGETAGKLPEPFLPYMVTPTNGHSPKEEISPSAEEAAYLAEPEELPLPEDGDEIEPPPMVKEFPTAEPAPFPFSITPLSHDFAFEPLHTVDYFASQGIKIDLNEPPTDNFSRHLKSFTEWLKSMKRLNPLDPMEDLDAATEAEIQLLASNANNQREAVVTESMAHVWVLQGKINKAIEVYRKLSLQHPEKRAYFAGKIEHLNKL